MKRLRRSKFSAFVLGLIWASVGSAAAVGTYYYFAPPLSDDATAETTIDRWARHAGPLADTTTVTSVESVSPAAAEPIRADAEISRAQSRVAQHQADVDAQRVLTRSIQQELIRVGCYQGAIDGRWSDSTRSAMEAFTRTVEVKLPLAAPDYILLTMLQGQSAQTCNAAKATTITARAAPAPVPAPRPARHAERVAQGPAWSTSVSSTPAAQSAAEPQTRTASIPAPVPTERLTPLPPAPVLAQPASPPPAILPGRMAVGAPTAAEPAIASTTAGAPVVAAPAPRAAAAARASAAAPASRPRRESPPQRAASNDGGSRGQVFRSLNLNAP